MIVIVFFHVLVTLCAVVTATDTTFYGKGFLAIVDREKPGDGATSPGSERTGLLDTMRLGKIDFMLENMNRRIESLETKLTRCEVKLDVKLEKIEEAVLAKDIRGDYATDQLSRQIDSLGDKVMNKVAFLEAKIGMRIDNLNSRFERSERHLQHSLDEVLKKLVKTDDQSVQLENRLWTHLSQVDKEVTASILDVKSYMKDEITSALTKNMQDINIKIESGLQEMETELVELGQNLISDIKSTVKGTAGDIESRVKELEIKANHSCGDANRARGGFRDNSRTEPEHNIFTSQTDEKLHNLTNTMSEALRLGEEKFKELDTDVEIYSKKVVTAYYELMRISKEMETHLTASLDSGNQTRVTVREGFQKIYNQLRPLIALEPKIEELVGSLQKKLLDLSTTVDRSFASLLVAQNTFISSCHRIQQDQPQVEGKIYDILQRIIKSKRPRKSTCASNSDSTQSDPNHQSMDVRKAITNLIWMVTNIGNQTEDDLKSIIGQLTTIQRATSKPMCMIYYGDWNSLSDACHTMRAKPPPLQQKKAMPNPNANGENPLNDSASGDSPRKTISVIPPRRYTSRYISATTSPIPRPSHMSESMPQTDRNPLWSSRTRGANPPAGKQQTKNRETDEPMVRDEQKSLVSSDYMKDEIDLDSMVIDDDKHSNVSGSLEDLESVDYDYDSAEDSAEK